MIGGEVLVLVGGDQEEGVAALDRVVLGRIGDDDAAVHGVAGAFDGDEEELIGEERGGGRGDVARLGYLRAADGEEVSDGGEVEKFRRSRPEEGVGVAWVGRLVGGGGGAVVADGGGEQLSLYVVQIGVVP